MPGDAASIVHDGDRLSPAHGWAVWRGRLSRKARIEGSCGGDGWTESGAEDEERRGEPQWR